MGIFIAKGMTVSIPAGGLTLAFGEGSKITGNVTLHVRFDVCPTWVELALRHIHDAKESQSARQRAWAGTDEGEKATTLEREFESSMQAVMAAAVALDAFYSIVKTHVRIPQDLSDQWRETRTARYAQVAEVLRLAFHLKPEATDRLRNDLKQIYKLRNLAVHPSGQIKASVLHPELNVGVEWRFVSFRAHSAEQVVNGATWILWDLAHAAKPTDSVVIEYMSNMRDRLEAVFPNGHPNANQRNAPSP